MLICFIDILAETRNVDSALNIIRANRGRESECVSIAAVCMARDILESDQRDDVDAIRDVIEDFTDMLFTFTQHLRMADKICT